MQRSRGEAGMIHDDGDAADAKCMSGKLRHRTEDVVAPDGSQIGACKLTLAQLADVGFDANEGIIGSEKDLAGWHAIHDRRHAGRIGRVRRIVKQAPQTSMSAVAIGS
jgi:hypothetical protein